MGSPPLRARMSGAVSRLISSRADIGEILMRRRAEHRDADDEGMENETERKKEHGPHDERDCVVAMAAHWDRGRAGIASVIERNAIVNRPGEKRAEQHDRAEIAVRYEVCGRPRLHTDKHRMLERAPDVAAAI